MTQNILTGIADEAGADIDSQIAAHRDLGWNAIELRLINGRNAAGDLAQDQFDAAAARIEEAGLTVTGFASAIGNWSRKIGDDFSRDVTELRTAIPRMQRFGTKFIRTMSWVGTGVDDSDWRNEVFRRYRELASIAEDGGVLLAHENCTGWAGQSARHMRDLLEAVDSPNLVVLFDIGNTLSYGQSTWSFYQEIKDQIRYVHIKDSLRNGGYAFPGEGDAIVPEVVGDLLKTGYNGVFSIEPHIANIVHDGGAKASPEEMYQSYLRYGRMAMELLAAVRPSSSG